jgi:prolyl oligopeptidase
MTHMNLVLESPPHTPVEPVTEMYHGVEVTDSYRWLEDQNSERTRKWIDEQTRYARAYLDGIPGRERITKRVAQLLAADVITTPIKVRNRFFFLKRGASADYSVICMREGDEGEDQSLVDPSSPAFGPGKSAHVVAISNDAKLLAYGVKRGGEDSESVEILDVDSRTKLEDGLPHGFLHGLVFAADSKSYYYVHEAMGTSRHNAVYKHTIGIHLLRDREVFSTRNDPNIKLGIWKLGDHHLGYWITRFGVTVANDLYVKDLLADDPPNLIAEGMESPFLPYVVEGRIFILTNWQAPNGRIVAFDLNSAEKGSLQEIIPESALPIKSFAVAAGTLFVSYVQHISIRTDIYNTSGRKIGALPYPAYGTVKVFSGLAESDEVFYEFTSFAHPPTTFRYRIKTQEQKVWAKKKVPLDTSSINVTQVWYESKDGTKVPMFLVGKKGIRKTRNNPTILTGYGGFGASLTPSFKSYLVLLIEKGCFLALANVRGGSELGREWHLAGKRQCRQNAFDDFIAAAEWLIDNEYATPERLAIVGGSNGGLLVGAALTQRPDLFRAVVCSGPLLDMLRYHRFDFARFWVDEYGSSDDPEDFDYLYKYSPYHHVRRGVEYPAVLFISGDADTRCNALHVRKMTAKVQGANACATPILMEYRSLRGHLPGLPLTERIEAMTDRVAFICDQLGVGRELEIGDD